MRWRTNLQTLMIGEKSPLRILHFNVTACPWRITKLGQTVDLEAYAGHYSGQPWVAESVMLPWAGGLVSLSLPNNDPVGNLEFFKPKGGDIFRAVREDGSEAEELKFTRDASGKVTGYIQSSNPKLRMPPIEKP